MLRLLAVLAALAPSARAGEAAVQVSAVHPILAVATDIPALRASISVEAERLFRTPQPMIDSGYLQPAAASEAGVDVKDEARRVVAGLVVRPEVIEEGFDEIAAALGNGAAQRLHFAARTLENKPELAQTLEQVRRTIGVDDPFYAERLRVRLKRMFDDGIRGSAGEVVKDGREKFHRRAGLHENPKGPAKILPFKRTAKEPKPRE